MLNTATEVVYRFPDQPFKFQLRTDHLDGLAPTQEPFTIEPHQLPFPRSFVRSNHVLEDVLAPTLKNWLALECNAGKIRDELMQDLLIRSLRQSLQWLSSTHRDGYGDLQVGLGAFMKIYLLPDPTVLEDPKVPESRGWSLSLSDVRDCAEAILKEDDATSIPGSPYHFTHRAVVLFTAPELLPTKMFEAIVKAAPNFSVQLGESNSAVTAGREAEDEDVAKAQSWLTYVWRRLTYLQVRMAILTTTTDSLVFYINEGVIQVTDRFAPGRASDAQPIAARLPFFLAVHLLSEEDLALPHYCLNKAAAAQEHEALYSVWKKLDPSDPRPRFEGVDYAYEPTPQVPEEEDDQALFTFDLNTMPSQAQESPDSPTKSYNWEQPVFLSTLGSPTILLTVHSKLKEAQESERELYRIRYGDDLVSPRPEGLFRGPIDVNKLKHALPALLVDPVTPEADNDEAVGEYSNEEKKQSAKWPERLRPQRLVLDKHLSRGRLWDVYSVTAGPGASRLPFPLVAKMAYIDEDQDEDDFNGLSDCVSRDGEESDHRFYDYRRREIQELETLVQLREVQGTLLPRVVGLWCTVLDGRETWMLLEEDVGPAVTAHDLTERDKQEIRDLFTQLHRHAVHGDVRFDNIRKGLPTAGGPASKRLISSCHAIILAGKTQDFQDIYKTDEMRLVERLINPSSDGW